MTSLYLFLLFPLMAIVAKHLVTLEIDEQDVCVEWK